MSQILDRIAKQKLNFALKQFTRAKALRAINSDNHSEERFTKHKNKHVRSRAEHLANKQSVEEGHQAQELDAHRAQRETEEAASE